MENKTKFISILKREDMPTPKISISSIFRYFENNIRRLTKALFCSNKMCIFKYFPIYIRKCSFNNVLIDNI